MRQETGKVANQIRKDSDLEPVAYHVSAKFLLEDRRHLNL